MIAAPPRLREEDQVPGQVRDVRQDLEDPWREIQRELAASVHEDTYRLWFSPLTPVSRRGATLYLTGPQRVVRWVGRRYMDLLRAATNRAVDGLREVELVSPDDATAAPNRRRRGRGGVQLVAPGRSTRRSRGLHRGRLPGRAQSRLHLRPLRHRPRQPARACRCAGHRRGPRGVLQPALSPRPSRPGQ